MPLQAMPQGMPQPWAQPVALAVAPVPQPPAAPWAWNSPWLRPPGKIREKHLLVKNQKGGFRDESHIFMPIFVKLFMFPFFSRKKREDGLEMVCHFQK